jgi:tetratricopeptide (TPR) repeat protein
LGRGNRLQEAEPFFRQAVATADQVAADWPGEREYQKVVAGNHASLGLLLFDTGRLQEAEQEFCHALGLQEKLAADFPDVPEYRRWLAMTYGNFGGLLVRAGQLKEGEKNLDQGRKLYEKLTADFPTVASYPSDLGNVLQTLALCLAGGEDGPDSKRDAPDSKREGLDRCRLLVEEAIRRQKAALDLQPKNQEYREKLGNHYGNLAMFLTEFKSPDAERAHRQAIDYKKQLVADFPGLVNYRSALGASLHNFALLLWDQGKLEEARKLFEQSIGHQQTALKANPRSSVYLRFLRNGVSTLATTYKGMPQFAEHEKACRELVTALEKLMEEGPKLPPDQYEERVRALLKEAAQRKQPKEN